MHSVVLRRIIGWLPYRIGIVKSFIVHSSRQPIICQGQFMLFLPVSRWMYFVGYVLQNEMFASKRCLRIFSVAGPESVVGWLIGHSSPGRHLRGGNGWVASIPRLWILFCFRMESMRRLDLREERCSLKNGNFVPRVRLPIRRVVGALPLYTQKMGGVTPLRHGFLSSSACCRISGLHSRPGHISSRIWYRCGSDRLNCNLFQYTGRFRTKPNVTSFNHSGSRCWRIS